MNAIHPSVSILLDWAAGILPGFAVDNVQVIVETPWSLVLRLETRDRSAVYLKQVPAPLFIETAVLKTCRLSCGIDYVPDIIAENKELHCFLLTESGVDSLRSIFANGFDAGLMAGAMTLYRKMQRQTIDHTEAFLQIGVPDWRLHNLPRMYQDLVEDHAFLLVEGLTTADITCLQNLVEPYKNLCKELAGCDLPESLCHGDFHDNNVLLNHASGALNIIDVGEMAVEHPFFSLAACFARVTARYKIPSHIPDYNRFYVACFENWGLSKGQLENILSVIHLLLPVHAAFAHRRLLQAAGNANIQHVERMQNRIKHNLQRFILGMSKG